eukprot:PhM_4_TR12954/c0_g1_i1/m.60122
MTTSNTSPDDALSHHHHVVELTAKSGTWAERNAMMNIINTTDKPMTRNSVHAEHGKFIREPPQTIPANGFATFTVRNRDWAFVGPKGYVVYSNGDITVTINWDHGFKGSSYSISATPEGVWATFFPQGATDHQQVVAFWISRTPFPHQNWMHDNFALLQNKPIYDICMPGTHDSGTYGLIEDVAPSAPSFVSTLKKITGDTFMSVIKNWSQSQPSEQNIYNQLMIGARYIDFRVDYDSGADAMRIAHGLFGPAIKDVVAQVKQFHDEHPEEFLIIAFNSFDTMNPGLHARLVQLLQDSFGVDAMVTKANKDMTLGQLQSTTKQRIFLLYNDPDIVSAHDWLMCQGDFLFDPWANKDTVQPLHDFLADTIKQRPPGRLFNLQGQLTDDQDTIINGVTHGEGGTVPHSLQELAWMSNDALVGWMSTEWASTPLNIVFCDYLAASTLVPACIQRNASQPHFSSMAGESPLTSFLARTGLAPLVVRVVAWLIILYFFLCVARSMGLLSMFGVGAGRQL